MTTGWIIDEGLAPFVIGTGAPVASSPSQPSVACDVETALFGGRERLPLPATLTIDDVAEGAP